MKKTVQVNLSGQVFTLDDDAYELLSSYLKKIGRLYERSAGKDEILSDIEIRIAELLLERKDDRKEVINIADVESVIAIMGKPEDFEEDAMDEDAERVAGNQGYERRSKRLFRDPDHPLVGGVCSGIGYYFGIDPIWIRLAFAVALVFFGTGVLLYIILWVIIPEAKTTAEKLSMRGEPVNIDSIGKSIEDELNNLSDRFSKGGDRFTSGAGKKIERGIDKFFHFLAELFRGFFTVLGKVMGGIFIMVGLFTIVVLLTGVVGVADVIHLSSHGGDSSYSLYEFGDLVFDTSEWMFMAVLGAILIIGVPFIALIYGGLVLIFPNMRVPYLALTFFSLWMVGIFMGITVALNVSSEFSKDETINEVVDLASRGLLSDTILLEVGEDPFDISDDRSYYANNDMMLRVESDQIIVGNVAFDIRIASEEQVSLEVKRSARANSYELASKRADDIEYHFETSENRLTLDPFFSYPVSELLRDQELELVLRIPIGQTVFLSRRMKRIIEDIDNVHNMYDPKMVDHYWQMTEDGLRCLDCDEHAFPTTNDLDDQDEAQDDFVVKSDPEEVVVNLLVADF
jgi:phage shock protein PspC (stress-responsive transcriptional regulator)